MITSSHIKRWLGVLHAWVVCLIPTLKDCFCASRVSRGCFWFFYRNTPPRPPRFYLLVCEQTKSLNSALIQTLAFISTGHFIRHTYLVNVQIKLSLGFSFFFFFLNAQIRFPLVHMLKQYLRLKKNHEP